VWESRKEEEVGEVGEAEDDGKKREDLVGR
jgi:hypothetical protein